MNPLIKELVNDIHTIMRQSDGEHDDKVHKARGILLLLKKLKINKIAEIQYAYDKWFNNEVANYKSGKFGQNNPNFKWPIEFIPGVLKLDKDNKKLLFTMNLVENWWTDNDYYEHLKEVLQIIPRYTIQSIKDIFSDYWAKRELQSYYHEKGIDSDDITERFKHNVDFRTEVLNTINTIKKAIDLKLKDLDENKSFTLDPIYTAHSHKDLVLSLSSDPSKTHDALTASPGNRKDMYTQTIKELTTFGGEEFANKYILFFIPPEWAYSWERNLQVNHLTSKDMDNKTDILKRPFIDNLLLHAVPAPIEGQILSAKAYLQINNKNIETTGFIFQEKIAYPIKKKILQHSRKVMQSKLRTQINNSSLEEQAKVYRELTQNNNNNNNNSGNSRYEEAKRRRAAKARKKSGSPIPGKNPQSIDEKLGMKPPGSRKAEEDGKKLLDIEKLNKKKIANKKAKNKAKKKRQKETRKLKTILANKLQRLYQKSKTSNLTRKTRKKFLDKKNATKKIQDFYKKNKKNRLSKYDTKNSIFYKFKPNKNIIIWNYLLHNFSNLFIDTSKIMPIISGGIATFLHTNGEYDTEDLDLKFYPRSNYKNQYNHITSRRGIKILLDTWVQNQKPIIINELNQLLQGTNSKPVIDVLISDIDNKSQIISRDDIIKIAIEFGEALKEGEIPIGTVKFKDGKQFQSKITAYCDISFWKDKTGYIIDVIREKNNKITAFSKNDPDIPPVSYLYDNKESRIPIIDKNYLLEEKIELLRDVNDGDFMYNDNDELWSTKKKRWMEQVKILQKKSGGRKKRTRRKRKKRRRKQKGGTNPIEFAGKEELIERILEQIGSDNVGAIFETEEIINFTESNEPPVWGRDKKIYIKREDLENLGIEPANSNFQRLWQETNIIPSYAINDNEQPIVQAQMQAINAGPIVYGSVRIKKKDGEWFISQDIHAGLNSGGYKKKSKKRRRKRKTRRRRKSKKRYRKK